VGRCAAGKAGTSESALNNPCGSFVEWFELNPTITWDRLEMGCSVIENRGRNAVAVGKSCAVIPAQIIRAEVTAMDTEWHSECHRFGPPNRR
jgi:hypothetical protein